MDIVAIGAMTLDTGDIVSRFRTDPRRIGMDALGEHLAGASGLIRPRAVYGIAPVGRRTATSVDVAGIPFESPLLREKLDKVHEVFPYIVTIGPDLENAAVAQGDLLAQYYLEEIGNVALEEASGWLATHLEARYGLGSLSSLSPGSLVDWPITEQRKLFSAFGDTERFVGVRLTDRMLMVPRKSISGILFPSEEGFVACQLCERDPCPGRKAPYRAGPDNKRDTL